MAQSLIIKDGVGAVKNLTVESGSYGFMPIHYVTSSTSAPVYITASSANPLPVTGNINVDVMVGDLITVTSSQANPVWVTGSTVVDVIIGDIINVTASAAAPVGITGTVNVNNSTLTVTSSLASPVVAYAYPPPVTTVAASSVTSFDWSISPADGTFSIASNSATRRGLIVFNPGPHRLFIALSSTSTNKNGFTLTNTASAPSQYSFIVYPSGTYTADSTTVGVFHGGYFISGSASAGVFISAIS